MWYPRYSSWQEFVDEVYRAEIAYLGNIFGFSAVADIQKWMNGGNSMRDDAVTRSEIVLALYQIITYPLDAKETQLICDKLENSTCHNFHNFMRLTNPNQNLNETSRCWAINMLYLIAHGRSPFGGIYCGEGKYQGRKWKKGAIRRLNQLDRAGALKKMGLKWPI